MVDRAHVEYCRRCGAATELAYPEGDSRLRPVCGGCGAIAYDNPKIVVSCVIHEGDKILWIRRGLAPYAGRWTLPSGFLECGETLQEAASREVFEEIHLRIKPADFVLYGLLSLPDLNEVYVSLAASLPSHDYAPSSEASEVRMIGRDELASLELGYPQASFAPLMETYDAIARDEVDQMRGRMWDIRGRDPQADASART